MGFLLLGRDKQDARLRKTAAYAATGLSQVCCHREASGIAAGLAYVRRIGRQAPVKRCLARSSLPPSIEINFNLAETMLWSRRALHLSFETACSLFAEAEDASRVYDETFYRKILIRTASSGARFAHPPCSPASASSACAYGPVSWSPANGVCRSASA